MQRRVFELDQTRQAACGSVVTALACSTVECSGEQQVLSSSSSSTRTQEGAQSRKGQLLVGLDDGRIEEYRDPDQGGGYGGLRLYRTTRCGNKQKPVDQVCVVSQGESKMACALSGGSLWILPGDADSGGEHDASQVKLSALKGCFRLSADNTNRGCRSLLCACRFSLAPGLPKRLKLVVLELGETLGSDQGIRSRKRHGSARVTHEQAVETQPGGGSCDLGPPSAVREVAWFGDSVLLRTDARFAQFSLSTELGREVFATTTPASALASGGGDPGWESREGGEGRQGLVPLPGVQSCLLVAGDLGMTVSGEGEPTGSVVQFPAEPEAVHASCDPYLLAVFAKSVYVYDSRKGPRDSHSQTLNLPIFLSPNKPGRVVVESMMGSGGSSSSVLVVVAHGTDLFFLARTGLEDQCREALRQGRHEECLAIAETSSREEERVELEQNSRAEAGIALLHQGRTREALGYLRGCAGFGAEQILPLFPKYCARWLHRVRRRRFWSMSPPLGELVVEEGEGAEEGAKRLVAEFLRDRRAERGEGEGEGESRDGVDTLLCHLWLDCGEAKALEALCGEAGNEVCVEAVEGRMREAGRIHALALLRENTGNLLGACELWCGLADGKRTEVELREGSFLSGLAGGEEERQRKLVGEVARAVAAAGKGSACALSCLPWLMRRDPQAALGLLREAGYGAGEAVELLGELGPDHPERWRYLDFAVAERGSVDPAHHTDLALALAALWGSLPEIDRGSAKGAEVRARLLEFLEGSDYYNTGAALKCLSRHPSLSLETVAVCRKRGDHAESLRILTFVLKDNERAVAYCEDLGTQEGYLLLLDMLLNPPEGPALYAEAVRLLSSTGASLNPLRVLEALSDAMPMPLAYETLARMLRERQHRKRAQQVLKGLARANEVSVAHRRVARLSEHVEMTEDRACRVCNVRIGTKVFGLYPNGVLVCYRCMMRRGEDAKHVCPVTGRDFQEEI